MSLKGAKSVMSVMDSKLFKEFGAVATTGHIINGVMAYGTYREARENGSGRVGAIAAGVADAVMMDVIGMPTYLATMAVAGAPKLAVKTYEGLTRMGRTMAKGASNQPFQNARFNDTQQAFTMRQAGMQLAKASKYNLQNAMLGNEAQYLRY